MRSPGRNSARGQVSGQAALPVSTPGGRCGVTFARVGTWWPEGQRWCGGAAVTTGQEATCAAMATGLVPAISSTAIIRGVLNDLWWPGPQPSSVDSSGPARTLPEERAEVGMVSKVGPQIAGVIADWY